MSITGKRVTAIGGAVTVLAIGAFVLLRSDKGGLADILPGGAVKCPLSDFEPADEAVADRPAVAVKIENNPVAYPLSGLEKAEVVYEELVEGGATRFMAIYHCRDSAKAGPVRSARIVDPAIMTPTTRILVYSGQNDIVLRALEAADIVRLDETTAAGKGLERIPREGVSSEHTLYADTRALRRLGGKSHADPPPDGIFEFGELEGRSRRARSITIQFSGATTVDYRWSAGRWKRFEDGAPFVAESGEQIEVDNVLVEQHDVVLSKTITDVAGNPSVEIQDVTGSGKAVLFRDGRAVAGRWTREDENSPVVFETAEGDSMVFAPGSIWIELVPSKTGEVKGSFDFERK